LKSRYLAASRDSQLDESRLVEGEAIKHIPRALAKAWELFGDKDGVVAFIVQPNERNFVDQQWLQLTLWNV
jgi:hypothetical protein